jgi:hypothetical protein
MGWANFVEVMGRAHCVYELGPFDCAAISEFAVLRTQLVCVCALRESHFIIASNEAYHGGCCARKSFCMCVMLRYSYITRCGLAHAKIDRIT